MANKKKLFVSIIFFILMFSLFACSEPTDENSNEGFFLIKDGKVGFEIILGEDAESDAVRKSVAELVENLKSLGLAVPVKAQTSIEADFEVLIGCVTTRLPEYEYDTSRLGENDYVISIMEQKIIIAAGSEEGYSTAIDAFLNDFIKLGSLKEEIFDIKVLPSQSKEVINTPLEKRKITIAGNDISDYVIVRDIQNPYHEATALAVQRFFLQELGLKLKITDEFPESKKAISIQSKKKDATPHDSFKVYVKESSLFIESEYDNSLEPCFEKMISETLLATDGDYNFSDVVFTKDVSCVYYSDFGAAGDGITNDFESLFLAHEFANLSGQTVVATENAEYYISDTRLEGRGVSTITIMTDVIWTDAKFIIDDTNISSFDGTGLYEHSIFNVASPYKSVYIPKDVIENLGHVGRNTVKLNVNLGYPALLVVTNKNHSVYVRYGSNANSGGVQSELVIIDENGNIDPSTPFLLDYDKVTSIEAYRIDLEPLTVTGGTVTTKASRKDISVGQDRHTAYFSRGLQVTRSNTLIKGLSHYVVGEFTVKEEKQGLEGPPYRGFYTTKYANNVTYEDCVFTARRYFSPGTYGLSVTMSNDILFKNCTQSNFYKLDSEGNPTDTVSTVGREYWGLGGSSYSKNMVYDGCMFTRFDAHEGLYNGKILNSTVNMINLIGGGDLLIENTTIVLTASTVLNMRNDYGSTWNGTVTLKDSVIDLRTYGSTIYLLGQKWNNHNFGYKCYMANLIVDNLSFKEGGHTASICMVTTGSSRSVDGYDSVITEPNLHLSTLKDGKTENINPLTPPSYIKVINNKADIKYFIYYAPILRYTEISGIEIREKYFAIP